MGRGSTANSGALATGRIFISYRRDESAYPAGWLFDRLTERFGHGQVFKDVDSIELGDDFVEVISSAVGSCDVLLALIGDKWLTATDELGRRRLDNADDFVRVEIEAALKRQVRVVPILLDAARMPHAHELPASLAGLARRQSLDLSPNRFEFDTSRLMRVLEKTLDEVRTETSDRTRPALPHQRPRPSSGQQRRERPTVRHRDTAQPARDRATAREGGGSDDERRQAVRWLSMAALSAVVLVAIATRSSTLDVVEAAWPGIPDVEIVLSLLWLFPAMPVLVAALRVVSNRRPGLALGCALAALLIVLVSWALIADLPGSAEASAHLLLLALLTTGVVGIVVATEDVRAPVRLNSRSRGLFAASLVFAAILFYANTAAPRPPVQIAHFILVLVAILAVMLQLNDVQSQALRTFVLIQLIYEIFLRAARIYETAHSGLDPWDGMSNSLLSVAGTTCLFLAVLVGQLRSGRTS